MLQLFGIELSQQWNADTCCSLVVGAPGAPQSHTVAGILLRVTTVTNSITTTIPTITDIATTNLVPTSTNVATTSVLVGSTTTNVDTTSVLVGAPSLSQQQPSHFFSDANFHSCTINVFQSP